MDVGPVLDLEDVVDAKVCGLAAASSRRIRGRGRCAAALRSRPVDSACPAAGSGLAGRDFADAGLRSDQMKDARFAGVGLSLADVTARRERFAGWPPGRRSQRPATAGRERRRATSPGPATARAAAGVSRVRMTLTRPGHSSGPDRTATLKPTGTIRRPSHDLTGPQDSLLSIITRQSTYYYRTARLPELN